MEIIGRGGTKNGLEWRDREKIKDIGRFRERKGDSGR